jgi:outer membrane protein
MRDKYRYIIIAMIILFSLQKLLVAEEEIFFDRELFIESAGTEKVLRIGLVDCVAYALKNNPEIKVSRIEPKLREDDIKIAKSNFEPTVSFEYSLFDSRTRPTSIVGATEIRDMDFNLGISGKLDTGTEYSIDFLNERYESNSAYQLMNPYYAAEPMITITQPLFRGFGTVINRADITIARNNKLLSWQAFKGLVMDILSKAKIAYYRYIYTLQCYSIDELSLERANSLRKINKLRYEQGLVSSVDLLETESAVSQKEKVLLASESLLKKAEDELKLITNLVDDPALWNAKLELIDEPEFEIQEVDLVRSLKNAFKYRPDYLQKKIDLENQNIKIKVAKNSLLPTIDLTGSFGLNGLGRDCRESMEKLDSSHREWTAGLKFSLPWGSGEKAAYNQRKLEKIQALLELERLEQNIILEVRDKVREVDIRRRQVKAAKLSQEKETQNYQAQKERYAAGEVSTHDMLDYQDKLAQAELDYVGALIDYNIAIINLDKVQGLTLVRNNITLEE